MAFKRIAKYYPIYMVPITSTNSLDRECEIMEAKNYYETYMLTHNIEKIPRWYVVEGWFIKEKFNINIDDNAMYLCTYLTKRHNKSDFIKLNESVDNKDIFLDELISNYSSH